MAERTWTCQRQSAGVKCRAVNPKRLQKCATCGKRRPATVKPKHRAVLDVPYERWVEEFGERCGVCGKGPSPTRKLDRDHRHLEDGGARGLLCWLDNKMLMHARVTPELLRAAADYLERTPVHLR